MLACCILDGRKQLERDGESPAAPTPTAKKPLAINSSGPPTSLLWGPGVPVGLHLCDYYVLTEHRQSWPQVLALRIRLAFQPPGPALQCNSLIPYSQLLAPLCGCSCCFSASNYLFAPAKMLSLLQAQFKPTCASSMKPVGVCAPAFLSAQYAKPGPLF